MFLKKFTATNVAKAVLNVTAIGIYEAEINGQRVSGLVAAGWQKNGEGFIYTVTTPVSSVVRIDGKDTEIAAGTHSFEIK